MPYAIFPRREAYGFPKRIGTSAQHSEISRTRGRLKRCVHVFYTRDDKMVGGWSRFSDACGVLGDISMPLAKCMADEKQRRAHRDRVHNFLYPRHGQFGRLGVVGDHNGGRRV